jgi:ATP-dependent RNA circularization protein (DNA/RNA ligase family)
VSYGPGYEKIETYFNRDPVTFRINTQAIRVPEFSAVYRWVVEEKLDGQNIRIHVRRPVGEPVSITFNGRTDNAQLSGPVRAAMERMVHRAYAAPPDLWQEELTLYGECVGPKIQKNPHKLIEPELVLFDVRVQVFPTGHYWAPREIVSAWAAALGCRTPTVIAGGWDIAEIAHQVREGFRVQLNNGVSSERAEGVVCRPSHELTTQRGQRLIFKLKTRDF